MGLFLINTEQMLIGKLSRGAYKPFSINDKIFIEKNLYSLLGARLLFKGYYNEDGKKLAETIGFNVREKIPYLIGYKKNNKDEFLKRYGKEYENIMEDKAKFEELLKVQGRTDLLNELEMVVIASHYTDEEIKNAQNMPYKVNLYTWSLVDKILIFNKIS